MTHLLLKLTTVELIGIVIIGIIIMHDHRHYHHDSLITKVPHTAVALSRAIELIDLLDVEPGNVLKGNLIYQLDLLNVLSKRESMQRALYMYCPIYKVRLE